MTRIVFEHKLKSQAEPGCEYVVRANDTNDFVSVTLDAHRPSVADDTFIVHVDDLAGLIPKLRAAERFIKNRRAERAREAERAP